MYVCNGLGGRKQREEEDDLFLPVRNLCMPCVQQ